MSTALLSDVQQRLLSHLGTDYSLGRVRNRSSGPLSESHVLAPPIQCPAWACILLPCIPYLVPSLTLFRHIEPKEAEVLVTRYNNANKKPTTSWICYDASSIQVGDVVRISQGDVLPADIVLLSIIHSDSSNTTTATPATPATAATTTLGSILIDYEKVTGQPRPSMYTLQDLTTPSSSSSSTLHYLFCGGTLIQGSFIGIVVAVGNDTITSQWIQQGLWPPQPGDVDLASFIDIFIHPQQGSIRATVVQSSSQPTFSKYQRFLRRLGYPHHPGMSHRNKKKNKSDEEKLALNQSSQDDGTMSAPGGTVV